MITPCRSIVGQGGTVNVMNISFFRGFMSDCSAQTIGSIITHQSANNISSLLWGKILSIEINLLCSCYYAWISWNVVKRSHSEITRIEGQLACQLELADEQLTWKFEQFRKIGWDDCTLLSWPCGHTTFRKLWFIVFVWLLGTTVVFLGLQCFST